MLVVWTACASAGIRPAAGPSARDSAEVAVRKTNPVRAEELIAFSRKYLRARYRSGGTSPRGFDCSGFTRFCFNHIGIRLPHSSGAQLRAGTRVRREEARPGDLIFFRAGQRTGSRINHVGLIVEVAGERIRFIHAAWDGIRHDWLHARYYRTRFSGIARIGGLGD